MIETTTNINKIPNSSNHLEQIFAPGHLDKARSAIENNDKQQFFEIILQEVRNDITPIVSILGYKDLEEQFASNAVTKLYKLLSFIKSSSITKLDSYTQIDTNKDEKIYNRNIENAITKESKRALDLYLEIINTIKSEKIN